MAIKNNSRINVSRVSLLLLLLLLGEGFLFAEEKVSIEKKEKILSRKDWENTFYSIFQNCICINDAIYT